MTRSTRHTHCPSRARTRHRWPGHVALAALATIAVSLLWTGPASADLNGQATALDARRIDMLHQVDARYRNDGSEPAAPQPNIKLRPTWHEHYYLEKVLAVFALVEAGEAGDARIAEANQILRYALWNWPGNTFIGMYPEAWNHRGRTLGMRIYMLYRDKMASDIKAEFDRRVDAMVVDPFTRKSENIKASNMSAIFLAHEVTGQTHLQTYADSKQWLAGFLRGLGENGEYEWGSAYHGWTLSAVLNLADFAEDTEIRDLARMQLDSFTARQALFSNDGIAVNGGVRRYRGFTQAPFTVQTAILRVLFWGQPDVDGHEQWTEFAASNYRPLAVVDTMVQDTAPHTARMTTTGDWRYHIWRSQDVAITTSQSPDADHFVKPSGGTHDVNGIFIQSSAHPRHNIFPYGHMIDGGPKKKRNLTERYFGYGNIAFAQHGGTTIAVWAGGRWEQIPLRLFVAKGWNIEIDSGWAFMRDGNAYVAWAPTVGAPRHDADTNAGFDQQIGHWLMSNHTPTNRWGEVGVFEVGDAQSHGTYANFKSSVLGKGRPRWQNGSVSWTAHDGTTVVFTNDEVRVNGQVYDPTSHPRVEGPNMSGLTVTAGPNPLTFDFANGTWNGPTSRLPANLTFGEGNVNPPDDPLPPCSDGVDNDGDGAVDGDDPGCDGPNDIDETDPAPMAACEDGVDNDGDGLVDLSDPGCDSPGDDDETNEDPDPPAAACDDGADNDQDGLIDLDDPDCDSAEDNDESGTAVVNPVDPETPTLDVPAVNDADITIDGRLDEYATTGTWSAAGIDQWQSPLDVEWTGIHAQLAARWSESGLYIAVSVEDEHLETASSTQGHTEETLWQADSLQIGIDLNGDGGSAYSADDREITFGALDDAPAAFVFHGRTDPANLEFAIDRAASTTRYEVFIPSSELGDFVPTAGAQIGFSFLVNDAGDEEGDTPRLGWVEWTPGIGWQKNPAEWGVLTLLEPTPEITDPANPSDPSDPNDPSDPTDPNDPADPSDPNDPNANQQGDVDDCACAAVRGPASPSPVPVPWLVVGVLVLGLVWRRRR